MRGAASIWLEFALFAAPIGWSGALLARYGDVIAARTGLSASWAGLALLATVTSLAELVTGISAVAVADLPNIALGDALGSAVFNLLLLVMVDLLARGDSVYRRASIGHVLSAGFGVVMIGFVALNLVLARGGIAPAVLHVGAYTPVLLIVYAIAMRTVFDYERRERRQFAEEQADRHPGLTLRGALLRYSGAALVVVAAGSRLPFVAEQLAVLMGWHRSFVGTLFVAAATSLPEAAVTFSALRLGAIDMAVANLLGSNLFDMAIIAIDDIFYLRGPLLSAVSPVHVASAISALVMTGLVVIGLLDRPNTRLLRTVGWVSLSLFTVYVMNLYVLYLHGE